jgi:hypothetical protein
VNNGPVGEQCGAAAWPANSQPAYTSGDGGCVVSWFAAAAEALGDELLAPQGAVAGSGIDDGPLERTLCGSSAA